MKVRQIFTVFILFLLASCGSTPPTPRNAELTVEYFGKKIQHDKPKWTNQARLRRVLKTPGKKYIVFGANWCESCKFLRRALREGKLMEKVEFLNVDEEWVTRLAGFYGLKNVPTMFEIDKNGKILTAKVGPGQIVMHIIINEDDL